MALAFLILGMAAVTFLTRYLMVALLGRGGLPPALVRWLGYVPIATFTAIAVRGTLAPQGELRLGLANPYLWGAVAASLAAWRSRNVLLTIAAGMTGLWLARATLG